MRNKILLVTLVMALLLTLVSPVAAASADEAVKQALGWLKSQQNADGGFSDGFSPESSLTATAEAIIALAAGGQDAGAVQSAEGASPLDYLYRQVSAGGVDGVGAVAKVVLALVAAGLDPTDFAGRDLVGQIEAAYDPDSGSYGGSIFDQALVALALANAGRTVPEGAVGYLMDHQTTDGAWNFLGDTAALTGDTNTTALVIQALVAVGRRDDTGRGLAYLQRVQNADAGWPYQNPSPYGTETDANSTASVLQAIYAVGQTPGDWYTSGADPLGALLSLQNASGSFSYQASFPGDNALATMQAIPAAAGVTLTEVRRVPTSAVPRGAGTPPAFLPESGDATALAGSGFVVVGLLLVVIGLWLDHTRHKLISE
jgi:squalene cyclase